MKLKHALVIGGSGMLSKASLWLADEDYIVSVIGRNQSKLDKLSEKNEKIKTISVDYYKEDAFKAAIAKQIKTYGAFHLVVAWIHSKEEIIISALTNIQSSESADDWDLFHVLGSSDNLMDIQKRIHVHPNCEYNQVQLGFVLDGNKSRWLTIDEISNGVIEAIKSKERLKIVGVLEPWNMRP